MDLDEIDLEPWEHTLLIHIFKRGELHLKKRNGKTNKSHYRRAAKPYKERVNMNVLGIYESLERKGFLTIKQTGRFEHTAILTNNGVHYARTVIQIDAL